MKKKISLLCLLLPLLFVHWNQGPTLPMGPSGGAGSGGISGVSYFFSDSTIGATWTSTGAGNSQITCGGKAGLDNGVSLSVTSHIAIVAGLSPSTGYSCFVQTGAASSPTTTQTTNASPSRTTLTNVSYNNPTERVNNGDTWHSFLSSDNNVYVTCSDCKGLAGSNDTPGANFQIIKLTTESTWTGSDVNLMTAYLAYNTYNGTDGPGGIPLTNKLNGIFSMAGILYMFPSRNDNSGTTADSFAGGCNIIADQADHGATWNNYTAPSTYNANGSPISTGTTELANFDYGWCTPIRYAADDGTIGYQTAGNGIDGANAYVYVEFKDTNQVGHDTYLARIPRIQLASGSPSTHVEYWVGSTTTAAAFVNDSNWSSSDTGKTSIFHDGTWKYGWSHITFVPTINSYVITSNLGLNATTNYSFYWLASATPLGPWTPILAVGSRFWKYNSFDLSHRDAAGNVASDAIAIKTLSTNSNHYQASYFTSTLNTTGMAPTVFDDFGQAGNENPISTGGTGAANWSNMNNTLITQPCKVVSNYLDVTASGGSGCLAYWNNGTFAANQYGEVTAGSVASAHTFGPTILTSSGGNGYLGAVSGGTCGIYKFTSTTSTPLTTTTSSDCHAIAQDDVYRFTSSSCTVSSCTLTLRKCAAAPGAGACVTILTWTDSSSPYTTGRPGLYIFESTADVGTIEFWSAGQ